MKTVLSLCVLLLTALVASGENRFPMPQFEKGYVIPSASVPAPRAAFLEVLDAAVLLAALSLAAWLALRGRSRRGVFLLTIFSLIYFGFWRKGCICPIGAIQNVVLWVFDSHYAIPLTAAVFFILPLVFALLFGRVFCAAVCPLGAIQDLVALFPVRVPPFLARPLGMAPYLVLSLTVLSAAAGAAFVVCRLDPFVPFFRCGGELATLAAGAALLLAGVFVARPYCRFLCPYGVLLSWMSRLSQWHVTIAPGQCVPCRLCERACPFDAIRVPNKDLPREPRRVGLRRLAVLLALLPALALGAGWAGSRLDVVLSRLHPVVSLAEALRQRAVSGNSALAPTLEAFAAGGMREADVAAQAAAVRARFRVGGWLLGGFLGTALGFGLIGLSIRRTREFYEPDRGACLSCGRCFMSCPVEHQRLLGLAACRALALQSAIKEDGGLWRSQSPTAS